MANANPKIISLRPSTSGRVPLKYVNPFVRAPTGRGRPIHLTATALVGPTTSSAPNNQALHNPVPQPIEIYDIKFAFNVQMPTTVYNAISGGAILAQLSINSDMITNGYVPIWCFDESTNIVNEQTVGATNTTPTPNTTASYGEFIWHLPHPLYVRPSDQINVSFQNLGQASIPVTCRVSLSGSVLENVKDPATRKLPYAAAYVSKVFALQTTDSDQSTETQLENTTDDLVFLHKMTGRIDNNAILGSGVHYDDPVQAGGSSIHDLGQIMSILAYTGRGTQLIPYSMNYRDFFGPARAVPLVGALESGDYVIVSLAQASWSGQTNYGQASVGLIGWREVPVR